MMFDPPDYPYKDLSETYDLLFNNDTENNIHHSNFISNTSDISSAMNCGENQLSINSNDSGRFFNIETSTLSQENSANVQSSTELFIVQSDDNCYNFEPTLLDENTVNQFLLPVQGASASTKDLQSVAPDLLSLYSCVICHAIFTTEADLLDHTISLHSSTSKSTTNQNEYSYLSPNMNDEEGVKVTEDPTTIDENFETEWLVCKICERVLSTALEVEPTEQLCCIATDSKSSISSRKLYTMYVCDVCSGLFADVDALDRHRLTCFIVNDNSPEDLQDNCNLNNLIDSKEILCAWDECNKVCSSNEDLKTHMMECNKQLPARNRRIYTNNNNNKMWNCGSCNQLFATARELYRHKRGEDRPQGTPLMAYVCEECDKVLGSMCALHTHKKMHKVTKPGYPCPVCGRRFNQSGHLAIHMRMHTGERPYPCDLCPKAFKVKVERDDHRRTHTGERPFVCTACPKTFTAAARLREHARIHTDQRPYRCDICGAAFRRPYARTVHTLIHTGEKPHECDICGTAFRRSGDMWKHKRTLHGIQALKLQTKPKKNDFAKSKNISNST